MKSSLNTCNMRNIHKNGVFKGRNGNKIRNFIGIIPMCLKNSSSVVQIKSVKNV